MSTDFFFRLFGMVVFSIGGAYLGSWLGRLNPSLQLMYTLVVSLVGALFGLVMTPYITTRPIRGLKAMLGRLAAETLCQFRDDMFSYAVW